MNFQNSETEPTKVGRSSCHMSFQNNSNNNNDNTLKNPFLAQNRTISTNFHAFFASKSNF